MQNDENSRSGLGLLRYIWTEWISTFVILLLLLLTLIIGTGEMIHGQLLRVGERLYGNEDIGMQYSFLRAEPTKPSCDLPHTHIVGLWLQILILMRKYKNK